LSDSERIYNELLALRCRRGDTGALEELVRHWEKRLFYYIRRLVSDEEDAWDVLQETWLKVIRGIRGLRTPDRLPVWLYTIARNTAMTRLRGRYADRDAIEDAEIADMEADSEPFTFEDAALIHYALGRISLPHREALTLHFLEGMSVEEIADVLGVPAGTVKSRLHFAKRALRAVLEEEAES
jgi:RNA polymerase sigma-70 factor (ECF subfamily)